MCDKLRHMLTDFECLQARLGIDGLGPIDIFAVIEDYMLPPCKRWRPRTDGARWLNCTARFW